jgi:hypothetical protein
MTTDHDTDRRPPDYPPLPHAARAAQQWQQAATGYALAALRHEYQYATAYAALHRAAGQPQHPQARACTVASLIITAAVDDYMTGRHTTPARMVGSVVDQLRAHAAGQTATADGMTFAVDPEHQPTYAALHERAALVLARTTSLAAGIPARS